MGLIFDERGVITRGIDEIRQEMTDEAKIKFLDVLDGKELLSDDSSLFGRTFAIVAKPIVETEEIIPQILSAFDANSAEGDQLDNLFGNLWLVPRLGSSQATGDVIVYGTIGTVISEGSEVSNNITGDAYQIDKDTEFKAVEANGVDIQIESVSGTYELSYSIDGLLSQSPSIKVTPSASDTTIRQVADRFVDAVNSQSSYLTATRNNDNTIKVVITDQSNVGTFIIDGQLSIPRSYMKTSVTSVTYNSSESKVNQITSIRTATLGWIGVTNPFRIFASTGVETNEDYRYRAKLSRNPATSSKYNTIVMAVKSVRGVTYENIQKNTSQNTTSSGITNNGLSITVLGGNEDEIALAIFNSIGCGIDTVGDIEKFVKDINGNNHTIRFSRPVQRRLLISMSLVVYPDFPSNGKSLIRQAIVDYFNNLNVGEDIYYSRLYEPINSVRGFAVRNLKIGYYGGTLSTEDIVLTHNELAVINGEDIIIGGTTD